MNLILENKLESNLNIDKFAPRFSAQWAIEEIGFCEEGILDFAKTYFGLKEIDYEFSISLEELETIHHRIASGKYGYGYIKEIEIAIRKMKEDFIRNRKIEEIRREIFKFNFFCDDENEIADAIKTSVTAPKFFSSNDTNHGKKIWIDGREEYMDYYCMVAIDGLWIYYPTYRKVCDKLERQGYRVAK